MMMTLNISQIYRIFFLPCVHSSTRMSSGISSILCTVLTEKGQSYLFNERSIIYPTKWVLHYYYYYFLFQKQNVEFLLSFPPADFFVCSSQFHLPDIVSVP